MTDDPFAMPAPCSGWACRICVEARGYADAVRGQASAPAGYCALGAHHVRTPVHYVPPGSVPVAAYDPFAL